MAVKIQPFAAALRPVVMTHSLGQVSGRGVGGSRGPLPARHGREVAAGVPVGVESVFLVDGEDQVRAGRWVADAQQGAALVAVPEEGDVEVAVQAVRQLLQWFGVLGCVDAHGVVLSW